MSVETAWKIAMINKEFLSVFMLTLAICCYRIGIVKVL